MAKTPTVNLPMEPLSNSDVFRLAGIDQTEQGALLRLAFDRCRGHLDAVEVRPMIYRGQVLYTKPLPDHQTRVKAIDQAMDLAGLSKKDVSRVQVQVTVLLPSYMRSPTIGPPPNEGGTPQNAGGGLPYGGGVGEKRHSDGARDEPLTIIPENRVETDCQDSVKE